MMGIETAGFNILERIVVEKIHDGPGAKVVPRAYVRRLSLWAEEMRPYLEGGEDRPGYPMSRLLSAEGQIDWTCCFKLRPLEVEEGEEGEVMELDLSGYSSLPASERAEVLFSFLGPVPDGQGGSLIYGAADRGFLWAHGFLCRCEGSFEEPGSMEFLNVWRS
ncbi:hypothetical protein [Luteolibacter soli]|uniref:Uncharacterized protein n=1 Tax=Luteolibacter soli TaxID=3135280 RepID=A0ABU9AVL1_9BACT